MVSSCRAEGGVRVVAARLLFTRDSGAGVSPHTPPTSPLCRVSMSMSMSVSEEGGRAGLFYTGYNSTIPSLPALRPVSRSPVSPLRLYMALSPLSSRARSLYRPPDRPRRPRHMQSLPQHGHHTRASSHARTRTAWAHSAQHRSAATHMHRHAPAQPQHTLKHQHKHKHAAAAAAAAAATRNAYTAALAGGGRRETTRRARRPRAPETARTTPRESPLVRPGSRASGAAAAAPPPRALRRASWPS